MPKAPMEYRRLGSTGLKVRARPGNSSEREEHLRVSVLSYGAWVTFGTQLDVSQAKELLKLCYDAGINFFDNAEGYAEGKAETIMGQAIKELGWKRSDLVISTKMFWGGSGPNDMGLSRKHLIEGTKASLKRLQLDYVDLIFCHRPDPNTPMEETVRAMNYILDQGWAFYWGTSEWSAAELEEAWKIATRLGLAGPAMEQPEYNLFNPTKVENDYKPLYKKYGLGTTIWSPLAYGLLTGKYSKGNVPKDSRLALESYKSLAEQNLVEAKLDKVDSLKPIAEELGCSLAQLAIAWCAKNPDVSTVIMGATKSSQLEDNLGALDVMAKLTPELVAKMNKLVGK